MATPRSTAHARIALGRRDIRRFEVDAPGTQAQERALLTRVGCSDAGIRYVPCDFATRSWYAELLAAGFESAVPACIVWEGVTMYLPPAVVEGTVRQVAALAPGSLIGFDCMDEGWVFSPAMQRFTRRGGEPWLFDLKAGTEEAFVRRHGLRCLDNLRCDALMSRYVPRTVTGQSVGACIDFGCFVLAGR